MKGATADPEVKKIKPLSMTNNKNSPISLSLNP
jgi:hypothetical protein